MIARLVHEAEVTEEFNLDDSFQLDQINLDELLDTYTNQDMHTDLSTDDNQLTDTNNPKDINANMQMNEETMETKQQPNVINTNNKIGTQNLDELTDNTTLDMHEQTSNTVHTDENPFISNTNDPHTHSDNNTTRP